MYRVRTHEILISLTVIELYLTCAVWGGQGADDTAYPPRNDFIHVPDPEMNFENLVESKHHKLVRSVRTDPTDRDLKPNAANRDQLNLIVGFPPSKVLSSEDKDLIWTFRFYLSSQKKVPFFVQIC